MGQGLGEGEYGTGGENILLPFLGLPAPNAWEGRAKKRTRECPGHLPVRGEGQGENSCLLILLLHRLLHARTC